MFLVAFLVVVVRPDTSTPAVDEGGIFVDYYHPIAFINHLSITMSHYSEAIASRAFTQTVEQYHGELHSRIG